MKNFLNFFLESNTNIKIVEAWVDKSINLNRFKAFSGWYIPNKKVLITFDFGYHITFMKDYFSPNMTFADKIKTPYFKEVIEDIKKSSNIQRKISNWGKWKHYKMVEVRYEDLFNEGWIKVNKADSNSNILIEFKDNSFETFKGAKDLVNFLFKNKITQGINIYSSSDKVTLNPNDTFPWDNKIKNAQISGSGETPLSKVRSKFQSPYTFEHPPGEKERSWLYESTNILNRFPTSTKIISTKQTETDYFSGWYIPNLDTSIFFTYTGHLNFKIGVKYYLKNGTIEGNIFWDYIFNKNEKQRVANVIDKIKDNPNIKDQIDYLSSYEPYYTIGWIRINLKGKTLNITKRVGEKISNSNLNTLIKFFISQDVFSPNRISIDNLTDYYCLDQKDFANYLKTGYKNFKDFIRDRLFKTSEPFEYPPGEKERSWIYESSKEYWNIFDIIYYEKGLTKDSKNFSAWYLPKEDIIIHFGYGNHPKFIDDSKNYLMFKETKGILNRFKYKDKILKLLDKYRKYLSNDDIDNFSYLSFYKIGWIRISSFIGDGFLITKRNSPISEYNLNKLGWFGTQHILNSGFYKKVLVIEDSTGHNKFNEKEFNQFINPDQFNKNSQPKKDFVSKVKSQMFTSPYTYEYPSGEEDKSWLYESIGEKYRVIIPFKITIQAGSNKEIKNIFAEENDLIEIEKDKVYLYQFILKRKFPIMISQSNIPKEKIKKI